MIIAADNSKKEILKNLPILCEDKNIPYIYVKTLEKIDEAQEKKETGCVMLIKPKNENKKSGEKYKKFRDQILKIK